MKIGLLFKSDENLVMGIRLRRVRLRRERRVRLRRVGLKKFQFLMHPLDFIAILKFSYANYI